MRNNIDKHSGLRHNILLLLPFLLVSVVAVGCTLAAVALRIPVEGILVAGIPVAGILVAVGIPAGIPVEGRNFGYTVVLLVAGTGSSVGVV